MNKSTLMEQFSREKKQKCQVIECVICLTDAFCLNANWESERGRWARDEGGREVGKEGVGEASNGEG